MTYYNDNDPRICAWLRELIAAGELPDGVVDDRSITEVQPHELEGFAQCHFFAGIGGWALALRLAGWFDDRPVWTGSCPCQPFSAAGKRRGHADERHLWPEFCRLIRECRPATVFGEQVEGAVRLGWLDGVFADLEGAGYACGAAVLGAHSVGAPHIRQRLYWVADAELSSGRGEADSAHYGSPQADRSANRTGGCRCASSRLADAERPEPGLRTGQEQQAAIGRDRSAIDGDACGLADAERDGRRIDQPGRGPERRTTDRRAGNWSDFSIIPCRDNKARRVESGTFPLVDGLPRGVVSSGDPSAQEAQATAEARQMRLRGYGNAIAPQLAAEFIRASVEAIEGETP
jgi:DNA (cytosine-5)-methyltransferase 1